MPKYEFPGLGTLSVLRNGEDGADRWKWNVVATDTDENVYRTWITAPKYWSEDSRVSAALDAIGFTVAKATGAETGTEWDLYASNMEDGKEFAASYNVSRIPSHYRIQPYSFAPDGDTFATVAEIVEQARWNWNHSLASEGDTVDVYRNNDDEPVFRFVYGPRGGLTRENY